MSSVLFTGIYLEGNDASGGMRFLRTNKYISYYQNLQEELGFNNIVVADNGSHHKIMELFQRSHRVNVIKHQDHLAFGSSGFKDQQKATFDYPYCWRTLWTLRDLFAVVGRLDKVILIDTDMFVLTPRLASWIKNFDNGWGTLWCPRHQFPEAALQVIAGTGIDKYLEYTERPWRELVGRKMETELPFTHIEKGFIGDRYGEAPETAPKHPDYYGQAPVEMEFSFGEGEK